MTCCEFCTVAEVPNYPLRMTLSGNHNWKPLARNVRICAGCIETLFFDDADESAKPVPIAFID